MASFFRSTSRVFSLLQQVICSAHLENLNGMDKAASGPANCSRMSPNISTIYTLSIRSADRMRLMAGVLLKIHTGSDTFIRPSMGSWITYELGTENHNLSDFITICPTLAHGGVKNWSSGFLPAPFQGTPPGNASVPVEKARVKYIANPELSLSQQHMQPDLLGKMNREHMQPVGPSAALEGRINSFELAFRMQTEMPEVEDILEEPEHLQRMYGLDNKTTADFGQQCLLARRFAERGVRFIQISHSDQMCNGTSTATSIKAATKTQRKSMSQSQRS